MRKRTEEALTSPAIGLIVNLERLSIPFAKKAQKIIFHADGEELMKAEGILFLLAYKQISGFGDYKKRTLEQLEVVQVMICNIAQICYFKTEDFALLDAMCDEIRIHICKQANSASVASSDNEQGK